MNKLFSYIFKGKNNNSNLASSKLSKGLEAYKEAKEIIKQYPTGGPQDEHLLILLDRAIEAGFGDLYGDRAFRLQSLNYNYDAIIDFDKAISNSSDDPNLYFGRGLSKKILLQIEDAILDLKKAIKLSRIKTKLNAEYDNEANNQGWHSVSQFYESQLENAIKRKTTLENEFLRKRLLEDLGEQKRKLE